MLIYIPIQKLASLIGKISATTCVIFSAYLRFKVLLHDKNHELK